MKKVYETIFCVICFCFSAAMLVLSLLGSVRLAAARDEEEALRRAVAQQRSDNAAAYAAYESRINLEEIERYASEVLGMQHCSPGQIQYIESPGD